MITTTWTVTKLEVYEQSQGQTNVVCIAYWNLNGTDGTYSSNIQGTQGLIYQGGPFTPYNSLTEQQVVDWVLQAMGTDLVSSFENQVTNMVYQQEIPVITTPPLPWSNQK
jgi:hypothetical protein